MILALQSLFILVISLLAEAVPLFADAYLSEDKVYYGADTYTLDYEKEIVRAKGHAFFRKGARSVFADRIVIYYGKQEKRALFYDHVQVQDKDVGYQISGERAEAKFDQEYYRIEGRSLYTDKTRTIRSRVIEKRGERDLLFSGEVHYSDGWYDVKAPVLRVQDGNALFEHEVEAFEERSGDRIYCDSIIYYEQSGDVLFQGGVLYLQGERGPREEGGVPQGERRLRGAGENARPPQRGGRTLVLQAESIKYLRGSDTFLLSGDTYLLDGSMSLSAPEVEYRRASGLVTARGGTVLRDGSKSIYSASMRVDLNTERLIFYDEAKGLFEAP